MNRRHPIEFAGDIADQHAELGDETARVMDEIRRVGFLVVSAAQRVEESLDRARITPLHRRVCHAGDGFIKVEGGAESPEASRRNGGR